MDITKELLTEWDAPPERVQWFVNRFLGKPVVPYQFVLAALAREGDANCASWLISRAGEQGPALRVECLEVGANVFYAGRIEVEGAIKVSGSLIAGGSITAGKSIKAGGGISASGSVYAGKNIKAGGGGIAASGNVHAGKDIKAVKGIFSGLAIVAGRDIIAGTDITALRDIRACGCITARTRPTNITRGVFVLNVLKGPKND